LWPVVAGGVMVLLLLALLLPLTVTAPSEAIDSIAILPFENRSGDPELGYVSDGITQGVISRLSQLSSLDKVISSSSVSQYKGKQVDAGTVAQEVDVRAVVMGNMASQGENLRIYVELVDAENNSTLWSENYTRLRSAVYELEETLSKEIADALGIQLSGEEGEQLGRRYTENTEAHEAYLKGRAEQVQFTIAGHQKAIQHFEEAIKKDSSYALAYTGLAQTYFMLGQPLAAMPHREAMPKAKDLAMKALEIDNSLGEAHAWLGMLRLQFDYDWLEAEKEFKLAIEFSPSYDWSHLGYAFYLTAMGRHDEAIAEAKKAWQLNPLDLGLITVVAEHLFNARRYDEAMEQCQTVLDIDPTFQRAHNVLRWVYEIKGMYEEAAAAWQKVEITLGRANEEEVAGLSDAAASGAEAYWRWRLDYGTERAEQGEYMSPSGFYQIYAALGEKDKAFEWLEKAYEARQGGNFTTLKVTPRLDPLRDDPRFQDLLRRMNLAP